MTKIGTLSNMMQAVLMVAVLTPAPVLAEPAATARQMLMLAQTQAQDHAVKNEVKKITERGPFPTRLPTPTSFASRDRELSTTSPVSASVAETKIEPTSPPMLSASRDDSNTVAPASTAEPEFDSHGPGYQVASIAPPTSSAPATNANASQAAAPGATAIAVATTSQDTSAVPPPPVTQPTIIEPAAGKNETRAAEGSMMPARTETKSETGRHDATRNEVTVRPAVRKTTASTRIANSSPVTYQRQVRTSAMVEFSNQDVRPKLQRIINRPEVRSLIAQYGLN
jgi:hypothetical protein